MDAAIAVFRGLGAIVEDVRLDPMQVYTDVKVVIAESELFSIHSTELRKRPGDFGIYFRGRVLPACLITSEDYRSEEHTAELQSLMRITYAVFCVLTNTERHHTQ